MDGKVLDIFSRLQNCARLLGIQLNALHQCEGLATKYQVVVSLHFHPRASPYAAEERESRSGTGPVRLNEKNDESGSCLHPTILQPRPCRFPRILIRDYRREKLLRRDRPVLACLHEQPETQVHSSFRGYESAQFQRFHYPAVSVRSE
eukprot:765356-Hanusia_phi.AAC.1